MKTMQRYDFLFLGLALTLGAFFLFSNMSGAVYLTEDEARPFQLLTSGPMIFLLSQPIHLLFRTQASVFYFVAFLNVAALVLFYILCRLSVGRAAAAFAVLLYAVYPLRIDYARSFYPAAFMEPFFLLAVLCCYLALSSRRARWMLGAGGAMACVFLIHYMGYALIAGLLAGTLFFCLNHRDYFSLPRIFYYLGQFALGFLAVLAPSVWILKKIYSYDFFANLRTFYQGLPAHGGRAEALEYLAGIYYRASASFFGFFLVAAGFLAILFTAYFFLKRKNNRLGFFVILYSTGALLLGLAAFLGHYWIFQRHFIWLISFYCLGAGVLMGWLMEVMGPRGRAISLILFFVWAGVCAVGSYEVTRQTFHITPVLEWLEQEGIPKSQVLTSWKLREPGDQKGTSYVPTIYSESRKELRIAWPLVYQAYRSGFCHYLMTSGTDEGHLRLGEGDVLLEHVKPRVVWPHPYSQFSHRAFYRPGTSLTIKIYNLGDIFSAENRAKVSAAR